MRRHPALSLLVFALVLGAATPAPAEPTWWLTAGGHAGIETGSLKDALDTEASALLGVGWHLLRLGSLLVGAEAEGTLGRVDERFGIGDDKVTVWRGRLGVRATWWEEHDEPTLIPYVRGGGVYRRDRGDLVEDDGIGWYVGVGLDFRLSERWTIGPFATYEQVALSITTKTWLFGLALTFSY